MNNSNSNMRVIPMDDYAYLTHTKVSHSKCPICKRENIEGAMVIYGHEKKQKTIMCNHCLNALEMNGFEFATNSESGYNSKHFIIERLKYKQKCDCDLLHKKQDGFVLRFNNTRVFSCQSCFDDLRVAVHNYNCAFNPLYINEIESQRQKLAAAQAEEFETVIVQQNKEIIEYRRSLDFEQRITLEAFRTKLNQAETKLKNEAETVVKYLRTPEEVEFFYQFGETDRNRFIKQFNTKDYREKVQLIEYPKSREGGEFIKSLFLVSSFPHTNCSLNHGIAFRPRAKYYIGSRNANYNSFEFLLCKGCLELLYECLHTILSDPALENIKEESIHIERKNNCTECYSCGKKTETLYINFGNAVFHFCIDCANKFFQKLGKLISKIDSLFQPLTVIEKEYPNYNDRVMVCKKSRKAVRIIGYPIDKAKKRPAKFIVEKTIHPMVECECIGHASSKKSDIVITTQRKKDNFCLALCKTCVDSLSVALEQNNYENSYGTSILIQKKKWVNNEHCMFCGSSDNDCNQIRIGSIEFCACNNCKKKLSDTLKSQVE